MSGRTGLRVGAALGVVAAVIGFTTFQVAQADEFPNRSAQAEFCEEAAPLDLQKSHDMTNHDKEHVLEDLRELAPEGVRDDFETLLDWYHHFDPEDKEDAREASFAVGKFIELSCSDINIGGIRTSHG
ncbi:MULTISPECIES: hypothetical protein [unclassified Streptomyces]|uniref:hypothetical protein n=1 Tax=unclassified Streptomyces TaxID=2593676 RepID=UPI002E80D083|nr:hypothetical protein [Streptomyces sp. NBC_00562]WUC25036.1 hypothetical protein OHA33_43575 [Streptomyces sp. NBC_00562]